MEILKVIGKMGDRRDEPFRGPQVQPETIIKCFPDAEGDEMAVLAITTCPYYDRAVKKAVEHPYNFTRLAPSVKGCPAGNCPVSVCYSPFKDAKYITSGKCLM